MSYTSKYTGQEIDNLLDSVKAVNVTETVLFEGEFTTKDAFSKTGLLSDNVKNYDYIILTAYQVVPNIGVKTRYTNALINTKDLEETTYVGSIYWCVGSFDTRTSGGYGYSITGNFGDGTQLAMTVLTQSAVSSRTHGICRVLGIKLGASAGNSESTYKEVDLLNAPVEYNMTSNTLTTVGKDLVLSDDIANYNEVVFLIETKNSSNGMYTGLTNVRMLVSGIIYSNDDTASTDGSSFYLTLSHSTSSNVQDYWRHCTAGVHFKTGTILRVRNTTTNTDNYTKFRIKAIKGIKY